MTQRRRYQIRVLRRGITVHGPPGKQASVTTALWADFLYEGRKRKSLKMADSLQNLLQFYFVLSRAARCWASWERNCLWTLKETNAQLQQVQFYTGFKETEK